MGVQDVIQMPGLAYLIVLAATISLRPMALRRTAALAVGSFALAIAALPAGAHPVTAGFFLVGALVAAGVAVRAGRRGLPLAAGALLTLWISRGVVASAGVGPSVLGALAIAAIAALLLWLGRRVSRRFSRSRRSLAYAGPAALLLWLVPGLLLTALGPHLSIVFIGAAGVSWTVWLIARPLDLRPWPLVPIAVSLVLLGLYYFMSTVAGPEGLSMNGIPSLPFSPAAEAVVAAALLVASWLLTGLWPLHRWPATPLVAPAAAVLLVRVGLLAAPAGMEHWRAFDVPLAMLGVWYAAAIGRGAAVAVGGAWLALVSVAPSGIAASAWLLPSAVVLDLLDADRADASPARRVAGALALMAAGWGGLLALEAGLHGEVVYTVLSAAGAIVLMASPRQAMTATEPSSTAPSA